MCGHVDSSYSEKVCRLRILHLDVCGLGSVYYIWMCVGWEAGTYECGSVYGLCMSSTGYLWVEKRVYISMEVFNLRS